MSERLDIVRHLRRVAGHDGRKRRCAPHLELLAFEVGALTGVQRLAHLEWLRGDAVLLQFLRLPGWPVRKVFSEALVRLTDGGVRRLTDLVAEVGIAPLLGRSSAEVDMDSSAIATFGMQEGASFGCSGKGRKRRRHHPLVASVAELRTVVHATCRDGSGIDSNEAIESAADAIAKVRAALATGARVLLRADSGSWSNPFAAWLLDQGIPFIFAMPLRPGLERMLRTTRWRGLDEDADIQVTVLPGATLGIDARLQVVGIRRRVHDAKAPPQGKRVEGLWRFYDDRADCERVFKTGRGALGMGWLGSQKLRANEAAFLLRLLASNIDQRFQAHAEEEARRERRPLLRLGLCARQSKFYRGAGRLQRRSGQWLLRVRDNRATSACGSSTRPISSPSSDHSVAAHLPSLRGGGKRVGVPTKPTSPRLRAYPPPAAGAVVTSTWSGTVRNRVPLVEVALEPHLIGMEPTTSPGGRGALRVSAGFCRARSAARSSALPLAALGPPRYPHATWEPP
jgi:hypothetical protein